MVEKTPVKVSLRAILFEDDEADASLLQDMLIKLGYNSICIGDLGKAVASANVGNYDIAIIDVNFCDHTAYRLLDILAFRRVPTIIVEGRSLCAVRAPYDQDVVLCKPFTAAALHTAIERAARPRYSAMNWKARAFK